MHLTSRLTSCELHIFLSPNYRRRSTLKCILLLSSSLIMASRHTALYCRSLFIYTNGISNFLRHSLIPHNSVIKARSTYLGTLFPALVPFPGPMPPRDMTPEERHLYQMLVPWCPPTVLLPSREASPEPAYVLQPAPVQEPVWMPQPAPAPEPAWRPEPAPVVVRLPPQGPMRQVEPAVATSKMTNSVINPLAPAFLPSPTSNKPTVQPHAPCFIPRNLQRPHYSPPPTPQVRASVVSNDSLQQKNVIDFGPIAPPKKKESTPIPIRSRETEHIQPVPQRPPELVTAVKSWIQQIDDRVEDTLENLASLVNALAFDGHW